MILKCQCNNFWPCSTQVHSILAGDLLHLWYKDKDTGEREQYLLFPLFVPLECGRAPCLLSLVLQELGSSLFLFERVELIIQGLFLFLQFLFLVLVKFLQTVKLLMQLCSHDKRRSHFVLIKT